MTFFTAIINTPKWDLVITFRQIHIIITVNGNHSFSCIDQPRHLPPQQPFLHHPLCHLLHTYMEESINVGPRATQMAAWCSLTIVHLKQGEEKKWWQITLITVKKTNGATMKRESFSNNITKQWGWRTWSKESAITPTGRTDGWTRATTFKTTIFRKPSCTCSSKLLINYDQGNMSWSKTLSRLTGKLSW